eukprot:GHVT01098026.1.p1 GENE.GHVT01098026.1~~GHVT01098026.1.p1  ORF type:complete len:110 (+),score=3.87 GHVT01098026.1:1261-1590(+)
MRYTIADSPSLRKPVSSALTVLVCDGENDDSHCPPDEVTSQALPQKENLGVVNLQKRMRKKSNRKASRLRQTSISSYFSRPTDQLSKGLTDTLADVLVEGESEARQFTK